MKDSKIEQARKEWKDNIRKRISIIENLLSNKLNIKDLPTPEIESFDEIDKE